MAGNGQAPAEIISLPKGGGAVHGLGEKFSPDLHTGTGNFTVPIAVPPGRNGFQPQLNLVYSTGNGNGPYGLGWSLSVPGVSRRTSKGIPRYRDHPADPNPDVFILSGAEDLVPVVGAPPGGQRYRPRTEGLFALIDRLHDATNDYWRVRSKDGLTSLYGTAGSAGADPAVIAKPGDTPDDRRKVFAWKLSRTEDPFGNRIEYDYLRDAGNDGPHQWDQLYLRQIRYVDYTGSAGQPKYLVSVTFLYDNDPLPPGAASARERPDSFSEYRAGFEIRTRRRCKWVVVKTQGQGEREQLVRAYEFVYLDERTDLPGLTDLLPLSGVSLLSQVNVIGYDKANQPARELPPLEFGYARFEPQKRKFVAITGNDLPARSLASPELEVVDLFGNGLPDVLEMNGSVRYWRNLGGGRFDLPRLMRDAPPHALSDPGVQLIDANGDGRADLLVTTAETAGYYPLDFTGQFSRKSYQRYQQAPSFNLKDPEVRLIDLTGDGITDVLRSGTSFECYFNDPKDGWLPGNTARIQRKRLADFPDVDFADPRVKFADMSGDGMQDIVLVHDGNVDYWPNLGYGHWGKRIHMENSPRFRDLGYTLGYDPRRILIGDIDGDGLADLVYVGDRKVTLWMNRSGKAWSERKEIHGTPPVTDMGAVRLVDLYGAGISGVLWSADAQGNGRPHLFFLDFTGGVKPYLLNEMDNHIGAVTKVTYAPSTKFYLADERRPATRWNTPLPFPVQVVERVEVCDELSRGKLTSEYRYHHGYWDGAEREFRGFGMVEQLDTEVFDGYAGRGVPGNLAQLDRLRSQQMFSPPLLTRTWFHQGPVGEESGDWTKRDYSSEFWSGDTQLLDHRQGIDAFLAQTPNRRIKRDALRTLRGSILRTELYAVDGTDRQDKPYTVTENAYELREEEKPTDSATTRLRIFFPHAIAQRTTHWERGGDPMTSFSYTSEYDGYGQPQRTLAIACPRGWSAMADALPSTYLATLSLTEYAIPQGPGVYIRDRIAKTTGYEIVNEPGTPRTLQQIIDLADIPGSQRLIAQSLNFYDGDITAPGFGAFVGLPLGQVGQYGAGVRSDTLVMTDEIVQAAYGPDVPPYLVPDTPMTPTADYPAEFVKRLPALGGYTHQTGGTNSPYARGYFATAAKRYDFHTGIGTGRGLVLAQRDPLGHETTIIYEYDLFPTSVTDPAGLVTRAKIDYRVMQPWSILDPNGNVSEIKFTPLGLVQEVWVKGKPHDTYPKEGDRREPGTRLEYGLRAFYDSKRTAPTSPQPVYVRTIKRVFHDTDPDDTGETVETREYSDGFGRLLQTRTQGEEVRFGDARLGGGDSILPADQNKGPGGPVVGVENADPNHPNVIVSGWQVYNNKGRVFEKYEPFFDKGWGIQWEEEAKQGVHVIMFYDPRGQVIRTVNPDGSEQCVIYGVPHDLADPPLSPLDTAKFAPTPWEAYTYDPNDNAGRTHAGEEPHTRYPHHYNTPASIKIDALGRTIRAVVRHREAPLSGGSLPSIEEHVTHSAYDIQGNLLSIRDALGRPAFEYIYDPAKRPLRTESIDAGRKLVVFDAAGNLVENRDAKGAIGLHSYDVLNRPIRLWARDVAGEAVTLREQLLYDRDPADAAHARDHNLLGKLYQHYDEAGGVTVADYDFKGNILESSRKVISDDFMLADVRAQTGPNWVLQAPRVNWPENPDEVPAGWLDPQPYSTHSAFDALNRIKWSDYPQAANGERYRLRPGYNRAGALERVELEGPLGPDGTGPSQTYVQRLAYNANGQRTVIAYGNGKITRYAYDPKTFRLARMRTEGYSQPSTLTYQPTGATLQDIAYSYDLAGNILRMEDHTPGCGVNGSAEGDDALVRRFEYDPLYRLTRATGREASLVPAPRPWYELAASDQKNDVVSGFYLPANPPKTTQDNAPHLTSLYEERYEYDPAGNMLRLMHQRLGLASGWSRYFGMAGFKPKEWKEKVADFLGGNTPDWGSGGNRLTNFGNDEEQSASHEFDRNGNMTREHTERHFEWDHSDRMKVFRVQTGTSEPSMYAIYLYDATGIRVKRLVWKSATYTTTTYLGAVFEHHKEVKPGTTQGNNHLHVMDDRQRIAIQRVGNACDDDGAKDHPIQYHVGDHLGSSAVVVSGDGTWINREELFPYGETSFGSFGKKRYRFIGKERDQESGLNYHAARFYSPSIGRWLSSDPAGPRDGPNLFAYAKVSPVSFSDPSGLDTPRANDNHRVCEACHGVPNSTGPSRPEPESVKTQASRLWDSTHDLNKVEALEGFDTLTPGDLQDIGILTKDYGVYQNWAALHQPEAFVYKPGDFGKIALASAELAQDVGTATQARDALLAIQRLEPRVNRSSARGQTPNSTSPNSQVADTRNPIKLHPETGLPVQQHGVAKIGPAFRTGAEARNAGEHVLEVTLKDSKGKTIAHWFEASEAGSEFFGHTEQKALLRMNLRPGMSLTMVGDYPPCSYDARSCLNALEFVSREMGVDITYRSPFGILEFFAGEGIIPEIPKWNVP